MRSASPSEDVPPREPPGVVVRSIRPSTAAASAFAARGASGTGGGGVDVAAKAMRKMKCPVYQVLVMGRSCCSRMTPSHVQHAFWHQRSRNASEKIRGLATERWRFGVRRGLVVSTIHHCNALNVTSHPVTSCWHTSKVSCCEMLVSWSLHSPATASKHQTLISSGSW